MGLIAVKAFLKSETHGVGLLFSSKLSFRPSYSNFFYFDSACIIGWGWGKKGRCPAK